jgi:chromosome segregation ATPase
MTVKAGETCELVHTLDKRLGISETKIQFLTEALEQQSEHLAQCALGITGIQTHLAKQNGAIPRMEANIASLLERQATDEKKYSALDTKQTILWSGIGAVCLSLLGYAVKFILTGAI